VNVLVLGWYHHRNVGDDRMQAVLTEWLDGHTLGFLPAGRPLPASYARQWDAVLIGGGGLLNRRGGVFRDLARWIRRARVPVALIGVSAEATPPDLAEDLRHAASRWCFAWFRDQGSLDALGLQDHVNTFVGPDLTWLHAFALDARPRDERRGVAVCVASHAGLDDDRWGPALAALPEPRPWPLLQEGGTDRRALERLLPGVPVPEEPGIEVAAGARLVVSARYHGLVFGLQVGRPVVGVGGSPKVRRLLEEAGLGDWWVPADRPELLATVVAEQLADLGAADARARAVAVRLRADAERCGRTALAALSADVRPLDGRSSWRRLLP